MILFISEEGWLVGNGRLADLDDLGHVVDDCFISDRIGYEAGWPSNLFISEKGRLVGNGRLAALDDLGQVVDDCFISDIIGYVAGWPSDFVYFRRRMTGG